MDRSQHAPIAWHALSAEEAISRLGSGPEGLGGDEAARRLAESGPNELQAAEPISRWTILLAQFNNVLIIILLIATSLSAFLGHGLEAAAIAVIVLFAVLLGFVQEYRAERSMEALQRMAAPTAAVVRGGAEVDVPARELVPGDVVVLHAGDKTPADGRLTTAVNLQVEESALTGESAPVEKRTEALAEADAAVADRSNMVFAGTTISYGRGRAVVVATAMDTQFGTIAGMLQAVKTDRTPLQENLDRVGSVLARASLVVVAMIVALGLFRGLPFFEMLIFGIALAVAIVPEALPAVVTISLAIGVQRMVKRNALIRRLPAVETLGGTSVVCSDKTGTLTKDEMTVRRAYVDGQSWEVSGSGYEPSGEFSLDGSVTAPSEPLLRLLRAGALASDAYLVQEESGGRWTIKGDPTEGALEAVAAKAGLHKAELEQAYPRVDEIPFSSETKRMTTLHQTPEGGATAFSKGAPETILSACVSQWGEGGAAPLDAAGRERVLEEARSMAKGALRVLAAAYKDPATVESAEDELTFLGLVGMIDPPRPEAKAAIEKCERAGIKVVMITGDHPTTAEAVARELCIVKTGRLTTGAELDTMSQADLEREVESIEVYSRVSPAHKLRVVDALKKRGRITAMTGDGVNDAPALKRADIGIAMGITGTDVTKEAAAMTLTDDNFASIVAAVEEARGIYANIKKYLMYLLSSNIGEVGLVAGASLFGLPLPLTAVQILTINLATDGLPALALAVDPPEEDLMQRAPRNVRDGIFSRPVVALMLVGGAWSTVINLGLFTWFQYSGRGVAAAMALTFVSLVLIQFAKAYSFRSERHTVLHKPFANHWLNLSIVGEIAALLMIIYVPVLQEPFGTFALGAEDWLVVTGLALTILPVLEATKWAISKKHFDES